MFFYLGGADALQVKQLAVVTCRGLMVNYISEEVNDSTLSLQFTLTGFLNYLFGFTLL